MGTVRELTDRVLTDHEDDDVSDTSPTSTLQREFHRDSLTSSTSSGHHSGFIARMRNSFSGQKVKDLKRKSRQLEGQIETLQKLLENTNQENTDVNLRLTNLVKTNPFNVYITGSSRNVQIGGSNTMVHNSDTLVADLEELTCKLTSAVQENTQERTNAEIKLRNTEMLLKEMQDSLEICKEMIGKFDTKTSSQLVQMKDLLETLTSDRSDERVITDGIKRLREYVIDRNRMIQTADGLPWSIRAVIDRLVYKFGHLTWQEFCAVLKVNESSIQARGYDGSERNEDGQTLLDPNMCARILAQWITQTPSNNGDKLLNILAVYQTHASQEMTQTLQKQTIGNAAVHKVSQSQRSSMALSDTSGGSGITGSGIWSLRRAPSGQLPDSRTQFEHQLEAWKLQESMNLKLDIILEHIKEQKTSSKGKDTPIKHEKIMRTKILEEPQFV